MNIEKAKQILKANNYWEYSIDIDSSRFSNGKRQFTIYKDKLYINEFYYYKRGVETRVKSYKDLHKHIEMFK